eukprot:CAMPEP_0113492440 /NCGR_PEP_ID=MMETSP0014_2-20120614/28076_1 /TAXON_ID=2857 /ORGANISM="Nitzschia sp." /LENGTH=188 /DNA_ID=CAMNT_0000386269 /DNA_START=306 /DNA_END=872 /DNA_ORIENTATION=- /assembly_acc=CAM_ASM_000159
MTSVLSPTAPVFHPHFTAEANTIIYNDGIPSCSFQGSSTEFFHGITDDTIDEAYPPTAEEAAELEAVEVFVEMMAALAALEDKEEKVRGDEHAGLKKRWEARRELVGRPRPAMHSIEPSLHLFGNAAASGGMANNMKTVTDIVSTQHMARAMRQERERACKASVAGKHMNVKGGKHSHKPIQQPRKHS